MTLPADYDAWLRPRIRIGRLTLWLWSGSWHLVETIACDGHCRNLFVGPVGVEWTRPTPPEVSAP